MCAILWVGQDKARSLELNLGLPYGWQGPKYLSRHLLPLRVHTGRKRELELESELEPVYSDVRCTYPKQHLNLTSCIYHQPLLWGFLESVVGQWPTVDFMSDWGNTATKLGAHSCYAPFSPSSFLWAHLEAPTLLWVQGWKWLRCHFSDSSLNVEIDTEALVASDINLKPPWIPWPFILFYTVLNPP